MARSEITPQQNWEQFSNLAFGVTTFHDPSNGTSSSFAAAELQRTRPHKERLLHQRAFEWLRDAGEVADAIRHGIAAGEVDAAADLLSKNNFPMVNSGRAETARALVASFPPEDVADHQPFAVAAAGITAMTGYSLVEKTRASLKYRHIASIGAGISNVLITAGVLTGLSVYSIGINLFSSVDLTIFLVIGTAGSELGAWLAVKYHKLNKKRD